MTAQDGTEMLQQLHISSVAAADGVMLCFAITFMFITSRCANGDSETRRNEP